MHARLGTFEIVEGKKEEIAKAWDASLEPLKRAKGFRYGMLLVDPSNHNAVTLTIWDTKEDMEASKAPGASFEQAIPHVRAFQKERPHFTLYQVPVLVK